jgi:hypothetical protein
VKVNKLFTLKNPYEKRNYKKHRLNRVFRELVGTKRRNVTFQEQSEKYYAHVYVKKTQWEAISFLANVNGYTKMAMVQILLELGISRVLGTAIAENNRQMIDQENENIRQKRTKLIKYLIHWAKSRGYEIGDFF